MNALVDKINCKLSYHDNHIRELQSRERERWRWRARVCLLEHSPHALLSLTRNTGGETLRKERDLQKCVFVLPTHQKSSKGLLRLMGYPYTALLRTEQEIFPWKHVKKTRLKNANQVPFNPWQITWAWRRGRTQSARPFAGKTFAGKTCLFLSRI